MTTMKRSRHEEEEESSVCFCGEHAGSPPYSPPSPPRPSSSPQCAWRRFSNKKLHNNNEEEESNVDHVLHWQRRDALLQAQASLYKEARDDAERGARLARDKLEEIQFVRFVLALEGRDLGINVVHDRNPVNDAIVDELNEIKEFRAKVLRVDHYEWEWGISKSGTSSKL